MARQIDITDSLTTTTLDTLPDVENGDSLQLVSSDPQQDSLVLVPDTLCPAPIPPVTAEEVFGTSSALVYTPRTNQNTSPIYESGLFQGIVLALTLAYLFVICRSLRETYDLLRKISLDPAKKGRMAEVQGSSNVRFLWAMTIIGIPTLSLFLLRMVDLQIPLSTIMAPHWIPLPGILIIVAIATIALYQIGLLWLTGNISLSQSTTSLLIDLKFNYFSLGSILLCPLILLYLLTPSGTGHGILYCIWGVLGIVVFLYLKDSFTLFLSKKIPILHWILYLCAVEIFPLSLIGFWVAKI